MTKVYPEINVSKQKEVAQNPVILTVWNKSMIFNCDGFTVYNSSGNLLYRVDNYAPGGNGEIVLMNAFGHSLLTIRHKRLCLADNWVVYDGETTVNPRFSVTKHRKLLNRKSLAYVSNKRNTINYEIEGSYGQKCCMVYDGMHRCVAEIKRKEVKRGVKLGGDVFDLVVQPLMDPNVAMALVIVLDQMFSVHLAR